MKNNLPVILLKNLVLLPHEEVRIELNNDITKKVMDLSKNYYEDYVLVVTPIEKLEEEPDTSDLPRCGVVAKITSRIDLPNGIIRIVLSGEKRVKVLNYINNLEDKEILKSIIVDYPKTTYNEVEETALFRKLLSLLEEYIGKNPYISNSIINQIRNVKDLELLTDQVASFLPLTVDKKTILMLESSRIIRAKKLINELNIELAVLKLENKIEANLKEDLDEIQKEMILKEKIKIIKNELGEKDTKSVFIEKVNNKLESGSIPDNIVKRIKEELSRYEVTLESNPELGTIRNYIEVLLSIPFGVISKDEESLINVKKKLNENHYGLEDVKERILEYVASENSSIVMCLIGPPGVGKTSLAISIALSLNKKMEKISLGGINDPAELIGHRKTYIGSEPGKIINAIIKSEVMNPVILLDEVDKMARDYKGDPTNVLLELLDSNQKKNFTDNYIEEKVDLSNVTFILTANDRSAIPLVLQDRLEIIEINSYLDFEKHSIAKDYLIKNSLKKYKLNEKSIRFTDDAIKLLITAYTKESGVRELDRLINRIIRKIITAYKLEGKEIDNVTVNKKDVVKYLKKGPFFKEYDYKNNEIGFARAVAYTAFGGEILEIEVTGYPGKPEIVTSGHLGETLKESIDVAYGYIKSNMDKFGIKKEEFNKTIHINFREGAVFKEGPSAGIIITSAILSYLLKREFPFNVSGSGEITLLGDVLPIGGLREKCLAAIKNGITKIYLSKKNTQDALILPEEIKEKLDFVFINSYSELYKNEFGGYQDDRKFKN